MTANGLGPSASGAPTTRRHPRREEPTRPESEGFFFLDDADRDLVAPRRTTAHRRGFAVRVRAVRDVGLPWSVIERLVARLRVEDPSAVKSAVRRAG